VKLREKKSVSTKAIENSKRKSLLALIEGHMKWLASSKTVQSDKKLNLLLRTSRKAGASGSLGMKGLNTTDMLLVGVAGCQESLVLNCLKS
jgi:hypothetical protein